MTKVFISGVFDLFHNGHTELLKVASEYGKVFVAVNCDAYVRRVKGSLRPIDAAIKRMQNVIDSGYVSWACINEEDSPLNLILGLKPDYLVVGSDYTIDRIIGLKEAAAWGGRAIIVPRTQNISTTSIIHGKYQ